MTVTAAPSGTTRKVDLFELATWLFAVLLGVFGILLATGVSDSKNPQHGIAAAIGVLFMTAVVAGARRWTLAVAAVIAVAAPLNGLILGHAVRCGAAMPAAFFVAYLVGSRLAGRLAWLGLALCLTAVALQCPYDPQLGWSAAPLLCGLCAAFFGAGRLVRSRTRMVSDLKSRNEELRVQQARTASVAVAADRARVASDLDEGLAGRLAELAETTEAGRRVVGTPDAVDAFATIEHTGRSALTQMRDVVGGLRSADTGTGPQPTLADLPALARRATSAEVRLSVDGDVSHLSPGVEVTAYRIVEHLIEATPDDPDATIDVRLAVAADGVAVTLSGPAGASGEQAAALAKVQARVSLHEGTLTTSARNGRFEADVRLPIVAGVV
jgi:signal transduction histidine kinase